MTALWEHLGKYDLDRRPRRVAANLLWDSTNRLVRTVRLERSWLNHVDLGSRAEGPAAGHSLADSSVLQTAIVAGVLAPFDATLIEATRLNGISLADAAILFGISYEAAKKRRQRAEATWVDWWAPELRPTLTASFDTSSATRAA